MSSIVSCFLTHWLSSEERGIAESHREDAFVPISYEKFGSKSCRVFKEVLHQPTDKVYFDDSAALIRFKFCMITLMTPWFLLKRIAYNLVRIVVDTAIIFYRSIKGKGEGNFPLNILKMVVWRTYEAFIRVPYYEAGLFIAALGGAFVSPYKGRAHYSMIEFKLHHNVPAKEDFIRYANRSCLEAFTKSKAYYDAPCLQPLVDKIHTSVAWHIIPPSI